MSAQDLIDSEQWGRVTLAVAQAALPPQCKVDADREDIVAETVARLLRYRGRAITEGELHALARRIARNIWIDLVRSRETREVTKLAQPDRPAEEPSATVAASERARLMAGIVAALSPEERQAVWMHFVEGMSLRATAKAMETSVSRLRRVVADAQRTVERLMPPDGPSA